MTKTSKSKKRSSKKSRISTVFHKIRVRILMPIAMLFVIFFIIYHIRNESSFFGITLPAIIVFIGASLNFLAMVSNEFKMPVRLFPFDKKKEFSSPIHTFYRDPRKIKFPSLSDVYTLIFLMPEKIRKFKSKTLRVSFGDFLIVIGVIASLF